MPESESRSSAGPQPYLRRGHDGEGGHDPVGVLLTDLGDEECAQPRPGAAAQRVRQLEALQTVAVLRLLAHDVHDGVHQLRALRVVALGPVVACTQHEVGRPQCQLTVTANGYS